MHPRTFQFPAWTWIVCGLLLGASVRGQTTISVTDPVRSSANGTYLWTPLTVAGSGGAIMTDGQDISGTSYQYDLVGTSTQAGFLIKYGTVSGVAYAGFRLMLNAYDATFLGSSGNFGLGFDTNRDGSLDFSLNVNPTSANAATITYEFPTSNASTVAVAFGSNTTISGTYFDYRQVTNLTDTLYPGWTTTSTQADAMATFLVPLSAINAALTSAGLSTITSSTLIRLVAYTSSGRSDTINQDIFGATSVGGGTRFDAAGGGFTEYTDLTGKPVPEPATVVSSSVALIGGLFLWRRRSSRRSLSTAS